MLEVDDTPRLHMRLTVLILGDIEKFEGPYACASHQKERDILNVLHFLLIGVLECIKSGSLVRGSAGRAPHAKNSQDVRVADN